MLESLRRGAQTWIAKILFGILIISFVGIFGISDVYTAFGRQHVAKIGSTTITAEDFQRTYQSELDRFSSDASQRLTPEQGRALGLDKRVLNQMVGGAAIEEHASDLGLALSTQSLVEGLQQDPNLAGPDGAFSRDGLQSLLRQLRVTEAEFLELRRRDELRAHIIGAFAKGQTVPQPLFDLMHAYKQEKRKIEFLTIDSEKAVKVAEPTEAELKEIYESNKARFMTPEYRKFEFLSVSVDDLKSGVEVTDEEMTSAYETTKETYNKPEQRRVQQIAFKDKATAEAASKALSDGSKTFGDVAKEAGAKDTDVDLGLVTKSSLIDPKIADVAFSLEKDKFSGAVEGRFATVVLRVTQIVPAEIKTFDDVKDDVRDKIAADKARAELPKTFDQVEDNRLAGKTLKEIADSMKLKLVQIAAADRRGLAPDGKPAMESIDAQKIMAQVFAPADGGEGDVIDLSGGGHGWVNVISSEQPKQKTYEEVLEELKIEHRARTRDKLVEDLSKKFIDRLNAGEPFSAIEAEAGGVKAETTEAVTRNSIPTGLTEAAVAQAFTLPKGRAGSALNSSKTSQIIFRVADVIPAPAPTDSEKTVLMDQLEGDLANQALVEYVEAIKARVGSTVNERELQRATGVADQ